jgi:hypothetical protein
MKHLVVICSKLRALFLNPVTILPQSPPVKGEEVLREPTSDPYHDTITLTFLHNYEFFSYPYNPFYPIPILPLKGREKIGFMA